MIRINSTHTDTAASSSTRINSFPSMKADVRTAGSVTAFSAFSKSRRLLEFCQAGSEERLKLIAAMPSVSGHDAFQIISACMDYDGIGEDELTCIVTALATVLGNSPERQSENASLADWDWISMLFPVLPEQALWQLLQAAVNSRASLRDEVVMQLDDRMQGYLFFEPQTVNRRARIAFACSARNNIHLRAAAGSFHVWMDDEAFTGLVELDDPLTFACFAKCESMKPHHLMYIGKRLAQAGPSAELPAHSDDAGITLKKVLEKQGPSQELECMRLARTKFHTRDGIDFWRAYQSLSTPGFSSAQGMSAVSGGGK